MINSRTVLKRFPPLGGPLQMQAEIEDVLEYTT